MTETTEINSIFSNKFCALAQSENFQLFMDFIEESVQKSCPEDFNLMKILIVCEEIIVNILNYAYKNITDSEENTLTIVINTDEKRIQLSFIDKGIPFNPLQYNVDERHLSVEEKKTGGLGLIMVKEFCDKLDYMYSDKNNIFTIEKEF